MTLLSDVEASLPDEFMHPSEIRDRLERHRSAETSQIRYYRALPVESVRRALAQLHKVGKAERAPRSMSMLSCYRYRRARLPQQRAA